MKKREYWFKKITLW